MWLFKTFVGKVKLCCERLDRDRDRDRHLTAVALVPASDVINVPKPLPTTRTHTYVLSVNIEEAPHLLLHDGWLRRKLHGTARSDVPKPKSIRVTMTSHWPVRNSKLLQARPSSTLPRNGSFSSDPVTGRLQLLPHVSTWTALSLRSLTPLCPPKLSRHPILTSSSTPHP